MPGLSLITCTGGRPEAFAFLEGWIARQTYRGDLDWIVVDDCETPTPTRCGQRVIRPDAKWRPGQITLGRNLRLALPTAQFEKILFIEDDEAYLPEYLETMDRLLDRSQIAGEIPARYYNVRHRLFCVLPNAGHASLCQTGIRRELLTRMMGLCSQTSPFYDLQLWRDLAGLLVSKANVVSIKGLPGRPGVGVGHRMFHQYLPDSDMLQLRNWIGDFAAQYERFWTEWREVPA